jgi:hypothetical protein
MEIRLRQVACISGLGEEAQISDPEYPHHGGSVVDQWHVRLSPKVRIDDKKAEERQAYGYA